MPRPAKGNHAAGIGAIIAARADARKKFAHAAKQAQEARRIVAKWDDEAKFFENQVAGYNASILALHERHDLEADAQPARQPPEPPPPPEPKPVSKAVTVTAGYREPWDFM